MEMSLWEFYDDSMEDLTVQQTGVDNDNWKNQNQAIQGIGFVEYLQTHKSWKNDCTRQIFTADL